MVAQLDLSGARPGHSAGTPRHGPRWNTHGWDTHGWDTHGWDTHGWDTHGWDTHGWDTHGWDTHGWDTHGWDTAQMDLFRAATLPVRRARAVTTNALEVVRYGGLRTDDLPSPFVVAARRPMYRLRHYYPQTVEVTAGRLAQDPAPHRDRAHDGASHDGASHDGVGSAHPPAPDAPVVLIPPLMMSADVYDVSPATSAVRILHESGLDPWVVDFGAPEHEDGGLDRTVADHILAVSDVVDVVGRRTGRPVHLAGYSQGGMFAYQVAAYRRSAGIASLITFGAPVDSRATRLFGAVAEDAIAEIAGLLADHVLVHTSVPAWVSRVGFRLLDPIKSTRARLQFLWQLHDREALLPRERQRQFLDNHGYVAYPGPAIADLVKQFVAHNRMVQGGFTVGDVMSTLADISCPVLAIVGTRDSIAPPASVRAIARAAPNAACFQAEAATGHFGLVVGTGAARTNWPRVTDWVAWREGEADQPGGVRALDPDADEPRSVVSARPLHAGLDLAGLTASGVGAGLGAAVGGVRRVGALATGAGQVLPRLMRLESTRPQTRVSVGALLSERARSSGAAHYFVFAGRGHTYAEASERVDNVVRGLLSIGVEPGERVGVLMDTRPSALIALCALNRIGAVAVLLRPDGATAHEARLGEVRRILTDPEHLAVAHAAAAVPVFVLGGGGTPRDLGADVIDLERIDPDLISPPPWYRPNPGRAGDLAFLLFTGEGETTRCHHITNGQWIRAALGTASAARLGAADTVYGVTPIHHPAGLLTTIGGALAGGSRLALATSYDPTTFWSEVRRYGVTVVSYTWTLLHDLIEAETAPAERHHPVRLFVGSGMPPWLWRRTRERFPTAGVLEFFVSTAESAVLANISGRKVGAKGRPVPGSPEVAVIAYHPETARPARDADGRGRRCRVHEPGLLVARVTPDDTDPSPWRDLLDDGDAWVSTGHVFRCDADGDHWLIGSVADLVHTAGGVVPPGPAEDALGSLEAVGMVAAYGVRTEPDQPAELHAAVSLRPGHHLHPADATAALARLSVLQQPVLVRVLDTIPMTTWWRPHRAALRALTDADCLTVWTRTAQGDYAPAQPARRRLGRVR